MPDVTSEPVQVTTAELVTNDSVGDVMVTIGLTVSTTNVTLTVTTLFTLSYALIETVCVPSLSPAKVWLMDDEMAE